VSVGVFTFTASFAVLWAMNRLWGIRVEERSEVDGLDLAEHGTWGYPEFAGAAVVRSRTPAGQRLCRSSRVRRRPDWRVASDSALEGAICDAGRAESGERT
jgi:hypothetical protein